HGDVPRQPQAPRAGLRVWPRPERGRTPAEHLRPCRELRVHLQPDHDLVRRVIGHGCPVTLRRTSVTMFVASASEFSASCSEGSSITPPGMASTYRVVR